MQIGEKITKTVFLKQIYQGAIFWLNHEAAFMSDKKHLFIVLNYNPKNGEILLLVNGTSQIEKAKQRMRAQHFSPETYVTFSAGEYDFFRKDTIFDCNQVHHVFRSKIKFDEQHYSYAGEFAPIDVQRIIAAVLRSDNVAESDKKIIRADFGR